MLKVGITGGIGSGKTTICQIFEVFGIPVFYADKAARSVMNTDEMLRSGIIGEFGAKAYLKDGSLNRKYLSSIVFNDLEELEKLNALVHPAVFREFDTWVSEKHEVPYVIKEAALLFESGSHKMCDLSVLVLSPLDLKMKRIIARDNLTMDEVNRRMERQLSDERKKELADYFLINDESQMLMPQILDLHQNFLNLAHDS